MKFVNADYRVFVAPADYSHGMTQQQLIESKCYQNPFFSSMMEQISLSPASEYEHQYLCNVMEAISAGEPSGNRTGMDTRKIFGHSYRHDLADGFPLLTTKKVAIKNVFTELMWFLSGSTNIKWLHEHNNHIWDEWADENGECAEVYGKQWVAWEDLKIVNLEEFEEGKYPGYQKLMDDGRNATIRTTVNQIDAIINRIKENPNCRRLIMSGWNVPKIKDMALPPCHMLYNFMVQGGRLHCKMMMR